MAHQGGASRSYLRDRVHPNVQLFDLLDRLLVPVLDVDKLGIDVPNRFRLVALQLVELVDDALPLGLVVNKAWVQVLLLELHQSLLALLEDLLRFVDTSREFQVALGVAELVGGSLNVLIMPVHCRPSQRFGLDQRKMKGQK